MLRAMYLRSFAYSLGFDPELLDQRRVDRADHHRDESPQAHRDDRQHPAAAPDVPEEQRGRDDRDEDQQVERGELRIDLGVAGAVDRALGGEVELEAGEVVLRRLHERHHGEDHRQVRLHLRRDPLGRALEPDAAVEVVGDGRDEQHDHEAGEQPVDDEPDERQLEDVEADVLAELRVGLVEVDPVREQDPLLPLRRDPDPRDEREEHGHRDPDAAGVALGGLAVPGDHLVFGRHRPDPQARREPVGDHEVDEHDHEEHDREHQRRDDLGEEELAPGALLTERVEPEEVGVEAGEAPEAEQEHQQGDDDRDHPSPDAEAPALVLGHAHRDAG